jgi:NAD(P)-dependent dehydrogenase (short-subunit alcohol dehydrogenase family)
MTERGRLDGQVAFVTGGGGGIGRGIALRLAEAGAAVAVFDIIPERCSETAERIVERGVPGLALPGDAMDAEALRGAIAATDAKFGRLDILVNNAGGVSARPFLEQSERSWRRHIDINLISMMAATHAAAPIMIRGARGGGNPQRRLDRSRARCAQFCGLCSLQGGNVELHQIDGDRAVGPCHPRKLHCAGPHNNPGEPG